VPISYLAEAYEARNQDDNLPNIARPSWLGPPCRVYISELGVYI